VVVRDGVVTAVSRNLNDGYPYQPDAAEVPTLEDLLVKAQSVRPEAVVDLEYDDEGFPESLAIDHIPNADDDEECYEVSHLRLLA